MKIAQQVAFCLLLGVFAVSEARTKLDQRIAQAALVRASELSGRPVTSGAPDVWLVSANEICTEYGAAPGCTILGIYKAGVVMVNADEVNVASPFGSSVLIHEMVHHLQEGDPRLTCEQARDHEIEAYTAERKYLRGMGFKTTGWEMPDAFTMVAWCIQQ